MKMMLILCGELLSDGNLSHEDRDMVTKFAVKVIAEILQRESQSGIPWWSGK